MTNGEVLKVKDGYKLTYARILIMRRQKLLDAVQYCNGKKRINT